MSDLPPDFDAQLERARNDAIRAKREGVLLMRRPLRRGEEPRSYIGGLPHLREDLDWPVSTRTGLPLSFIAQIDLRDLPRPKGVFFPAEGLLWFFADFSDDIFRGDRHTRVLFDPHPRSMAREREAPANLPTLNQYSYGWVTAQHPRAFVEPKTGLLLHLFDTFYDRPYEPSPTWEDFFRIFLRPRAVRQDDLREKVVGSVAYMQMIQELREEAVHRAIGKHRFPGAFWYGVTSGFGEADWPATSIDAEYALMSLGGNFRLSPSLKNHPCPVEVVRELFERVQVEVRTVRGFGPRPLAPAERTAINTLIDEVRRGFARFDYGRRQVTNTTIRDYLRWAHSNIRFAINNSYPHAAFEILRTMPEAEKYIPAELFDPYQEWTVGGQLHQMFGHGSSPQDAPSRHEEAGYVLLLQIGSSTTLGFPVSGDAAMHYWIPKRDLARGRFDRVEGTWEAG